MWTQQASALGGITTQGAGFEIEGKINRKDFGLAFNVLTEAGSLAVGEEVKLNFDIELILQP